jgi:dipeptidyl aminopeptidase/acylaminoacyl peptidase
MALLLVSNTFHSSLLQAKVESNVELEKQSLSLKKIMADPDWMGNSVKDAFWSIDGQSVYYEQKAVGHSHHNNFKINLSNKQITKIVETEQLLLASQKANLNKTSTKGTFSYQGDIYLSNIGLGEISPLTADDTIQSNPQFVDANTISYLQNRSIYLYDLDKGYARQIANFMTKNNPEENQTKSYLEQSQPRLFEVLKNNEAEDSFQKERKQKAELRQSKTWYLGKSVDIRTFELSPDANWLILGTIKKALKGKADNMPEFVTADGYVNNRKVRSLVGSSKPRNEKFYLVDLVKHEKYEIDTSSLPGINDDPLEKLKKRAANKIGYKFKPQQNPRAISAYYNGVVWNSESEKAAIMLLSYDNKDRWIVALDVDKRKLKTLHWMSDEAWINDWTFNQFGWLPAQSSKKQTLYYLSEEDGYSHIYIKTGKRKARQLTEGQYEVSDLTVSKNGEFIYFKANKKTPGIYEIYRVKTKDGQVEALTDLNGVSDYVLSPNEDQLLIRHSKMTSLPELYVTSVNAEKAAIQLTKLASDAFSSIEWQKPAIVKVASSEIKRSIYARHYASRSDARVAENKKKPAVIFVHGAGYLQNSHQGWSGYFREYMFHNMLTQQGYEVLDLDYRASKGYGRDWRTAIYRQMGTPELADLKDGVQWLVEKRNVDPKRVGVYGGSYGGFMVFMSLFKAPDLFAAGAALRPVTDWAHYNHGYTSNILNTPQVDPDAYEKSSPIEFAQGLKKPLLIAHGMVDDNVFFKDTVRLVQRLIELEKTQYFETAIYPVEPHGFKQPSSWLDEYTRIYQLFERHLN